MFHLCMDLPHMFCLNMDLEDVCYGQICVSSSEETDQASKEWVGKISQARVSWPKGKREEVESGR